jgi:AraC-like DNA-binding protein
MAASRELTRVEHVATACGLSTRSLQRLFRRWVGVGPKWVLARHRLWDAAAAIDTGGADDLADLAARLGWFDQAHFSRDFRSTVGCTPSEYLARARGVNTVVE